MAYLYDFLDCRFTNISYLRFLKKIFLFFGGYTFQKYIVFLVLRILCIKAFCCVICI